MEPAQAGLNPSRPGGRRTLPRRWIIRRWKGSRIQGLSLVKSHKIRALRGKTITPWCFGPTLVKGLSGVIDRTPVYRE